MKKPLVHVRSTTDTAPRVVTLRAPTLDERIDNWLTDWHMHRAGYVHAPGHRATASSGGSLAQSPSHISDWWNGVHDEKRERAAYRALEDAMEAVREKSRVHYLALSAQARCLATGVCVWLVQGLPRDPAELAVLLQEARNRFARECIARKIDQ